MVTSLIVSTLTAFIVTFFVMPQLIRFLHSIGVVGLDLNKPRKPMLPTSGGIAVATGVLAGLLTYIGIQTFVYSQPSVNLVAVTASVLIAMFVGFFDDLNVKRQKVKTNEGYDIRVGFPRWFKPLLTFPAAIPLMAISAGETTLSLPILGDINFGILYPLLIIPIGVVGASNMVNMLGGHNGLETGMGVVYMAALGLYSILFIDVASSVIFFIAAAALIPLLIYNWFPAKVLPGDSLTYLLGSMVAAGVIIGNLEKIGIIVMIPFIIQGILKFYSKIKLGHFASDLGIVGSNGIVKSKYGNRIFSLTHVAMKFGELDEKKITIFLLLLQIVFGIMPFLLRPYWL